MMGFTSPESELEKNLRPGGREPFGMDVIAHVRDAHSEPAHKLLPVPGFIAGVGPQLLIGFTAREHLKGTDHQCMGRLVRAARKTW